MQTVTKGTKIELKAINDVEGMIEIERMQKDAWGIDDLAVVPRTQLSAAVHVGGTLIGAFDDDRMIGFVYGFYGLLNGHPVHHSHMLAVEPGYRNHNLGYRLKIAQLERVREDGLADRMTWTFDPLRSLNAYFNFAKLGVVSDKYEVDLYGGNASSYLHRTGTDRLFVTWFINSGRVKELLADGAKELEDQDFEAERLVRMSHSGTPIRSAEVRDQGSMTIEIPADIGKIEEADLGTALLWRAETRRSFLDALNAGFVVEGYRRVTDRSGAYLLRRREIGEMER